MGQGGFRRLIHQLETITTRTTMGSEILDAPKLLPYLAPVGLSEYH
jgi:hypothetical protein